MSDIVYVAHLDDGQPAIGARTTLAAAQRLVEDLVVTAYRWVPADVHWENLTDHGYPGCWSYGNAGYFGVATEFGSVQQVEVTD